MVTERTGSEDDEEEARFSADATWSVDATVSFGSTVSLRLGVELLLRLTNTPPCNIPPEACWSAKYNALQVSFLPLFILYLKRWWKLSTLQWDNSNGPMY